MLNIIYTITPNLVSDLKKIAGFRQSILLFPLAPTTEVSLQFTSSVERIENTLSLSNIVTDKREVSAALKNYVAYLAYNNRKKKNISQKEKMIYGYKKASDYLRKHWIVSADYIDIKTIILIHSYLVPGGLTINERKVIKVLEYLQTAAENPVIQAAVAKLAFSALNPFAEGNETASTLYSYMFLYKAGLDFNGMLVLEKGWNSDINEFHAQYAKAVAADNITFWLEYYVKSMAFGLQTTLNDIITASKDQRIPSIAVDISWEINERQKSILALFDEPNAVVTNRTVQKIFKVSQITASRDLAKLASLGILFVHGKGRAVRYTKI
jgi:Fic family protein